MELTTSNQPEYHQRGIHVEGRKGGSASIIADSLFPGERPLYGIDASESPEPGDLIASLHFGKRTLSIVVMDVRELHDLRRVFRFPLFGAGVVWRQGGCLLIQHGTKIAHFHPVEWLLGGGKPETFLLDEGSGVIPLPEGNVFATYRLYERKINRRRWWDASLGTLLEIVPAKPIPLYDPESGKVVYQENFTTTTSRFFTDAVGELVGAVMSNRIQHGSLMPFGPLQSEDYRG